MRRADREVCTRIAPAPTEGLRHDRRHHLQRGAGRPAGSLLGSLAFTAAGTPGHHTLPRTALAMAAALLVTATAPGPPVAAAGLVGVGCAWAYLIGAVIATRQTAGPQMMGRVMALFAVVLLGGTTIGGPLATALIAVAGPRAPFLAGAVAAAAGAAALAGRGRRPVSAGTPA